MRLSARPAHRRLTRLGALLAAPVLALTLSSAASSATESPGGAPGSRAVSRAVSPAVSPGVSKVLVFVVENHSADQMTSGLPWLARLGDRYGHTTAYRGVRHPSLPNYLAIAGGSTFSVTDDHGPSQHRLRGASVFGRALAAGSTAAVYADGMRSRCQLSNAGQYAVRHNPWTYFARERAQCRRHDLPLRRLAPAIDAGALPAVGLVVPDLCHDAHNCTLTPADRWLRRQVRAVMAGPDWRAGRLAVVVTADEDDNHHDNAVLTVVAHPALNHAVTGTAMDHYALSRSISEVTGTAPLRKAASAPSLLTELGLTPVPVG